MKESQRQARLAGLLYVLVALLGPLSLIYIPSQVLAAGSVAEHIRRLASLLRWGIASEIVYQTVEVFLILVLYGAFKPISAVLARQMAALGLLPIPIVLLNILNLSAALMLANGFGGLARLDPSLRDGLAQMFFLLHGKGLQVAAVFWGLWLVPLGLLILRCDFLPKIIGLSAMVAAVGYVAGAVTALAFPQYQGTVNRLATLLEFGEPPVILGLLFSGVFPSRRSPRLGIPQQPSSQLS